MAFSDTFEDIPILSSTEEIVAQQDSMYGGVTTHPTSEKQNYLGYVSRKFSRNDTKLLETMWQ